MTVLMNSCYLLLVYNIKLGTCNKSEILKIDDDTINVQIWDTAGQERFKSLMRTYYVNADGIILLYDVTNINSFSNVSNWIKDITNNTYKKKIVIYLLGNKIDLNDKRVINYEDAFNFSNELKIKFFEVSVKYNLNVREVIRKMVKEIYKIANKNLNSSKLTDMEKKSKQCCL
jgi:small GTP-binding protein